MAQINLRPEIIRNIAKDAIVKKNLYIDKAFDLVINDFNRKKELMLEEFDNHPVTQEIAAGPYTTDSAGVIDNGNLFAFFGFSAERNPISELRQALEENTKLIKTGRGARYLGDKIRYEFPVSVASLEGELAAASNFDGWAQGKSWALAVEGRGFSDINYYLNHFYFSPNRENLESRSGPAIQITNDLKQGRIFQKQDYLSVIIRHFQEKFIK